MTEILLTIDHTKVSAEEGWTILEAARNAGIYIPALCTYPGLPSAHGMKAGTTVFRNGKPLANTNLGKKFEGCQLCVVDVAGRGITLACDTFVSDGLIVYTNTLPVQELRRKNLSRILARHPHTCLVCPQREGCDTLICSYDVPQDERCCWKFNNCELQKVADYIGIVRDVEAYVPKNLPLVTTEPLILFDYNLCIGCLRCLRVCQEIQGVAALGFIYQDGEVVVGMVGPSLKEAGCKSCGVCIEVCPTGALKDKVVKAKIKRAQKLKILPPLLPPEEWLPLTEQNVAAVPDKEGVYQLLDGQKKVVYIKGAMNLRQELKEQWETNKEAHYFIYEEEPMYTRRESELIQQFLQQHGELHCQNLALEAV